MTATLLVSDPSLQTVDLRSPELPLPLQRDLPSLQNGEILLSTKPHTHWGAAVTAHLYLPIERNIAWERLADYSRWVRYFPAISRSEVIRGNGREGRGKRLYQVASKSFLFLTAQVDIYLDVIETLNQRIQFHFNAGSFNDFAADLCLQDCNQGTVMTYYVQATPTIPVPSAFIQQAIQLDLPSNLRHMRQVLCQPSF